VSVTWLAELRDSHGVLYRIGREGEVRVADWPEFLTLRCGPEDVTSLIEAPGADPARLAKVKNGLVKALIRSLSGALTLHASAFAAGARAVVCVGASGMGKSTLAAAMCARPEVRLLADDMAPVEEVASGGRTPAFLALPSERSVWLHDAGVDERKFARELAFADSGLPVAAIVVLSFAEAGHETGTSLRPLTALELFAHLVPSIVRFRLDDPTALEGELIALGRLARSASAYELRRPRDLARLHDGVALLASLLGSG
jgi:hypothetical protein